MKENYQGPFAFSEAESIAIRDAVYQIQAKQTLASFLSVHAYSQFWMTPRGHIKQRPSDYTDLKRVSQKAVQALSAVHGTQFQYGPIYEIIYQATGSSVDWAYDVAHVKYSFALELRDTGKYGFMLPASQIRPTCEETYAGLVAMVDEIYPEFP